MTCEHKKPRTGRPTFIRGRAYFQCMACGRTLAPAEFDREAFVEETSITSTAPATRTAVGAVPAWA